MPSNGKLDVLAFAAHPDDVELCAGGTVCSMTGTGYSVGIIDLTAGELGSRGSAALRASEAAEAADIMHISVRKNLGIPDGDIANTAVHRGLVIRELRRFRPDILLINAPECRHPDHGAAARLVSHAAFYSGLVKIETQDEDGEPQAPWRPHHILHYMQSLSFEPSLVMDVTDVWDQRLKALAAFESQFYSPTVEGANSIKTLHSEVKHEQISDADGSEEPDTFVSNPAFYRWIEARARAFGYRIGATYGEPFLYRHGPMGTDDIVAMLQKKKTFR